VSNLVTKGSSPIYARKEPTDDPEKDNKAYPLSSAIIAKKKDVQLYYDQETTKPAGRYPWHYKSKPTRRNKRISLDYGKHDLVWLPDLGN